MTLRLRITLAIPDPARRAIALLRPDGRRTRRGAMATRSVIASYVQGRLDALSQLAPWWDDEPLTPLELDDARAAVELLRGAGKGDSEIRAWLLTQRARYDIRRFQHGKPT